MNSSSSSDQNTVDRLAEEFVARHRRGEHPALSEYTDQFPQYAEQIRDLFPALVLIEQVKPGEGEPTGTYAGADSAQGLRLERLGDFRILGEVGRGGMGVVYEAEQESLGRHVALKVLPGHALLDPRQLVRFQREARAAARLHHTNIVPVFGVGEQDGVHYYVMQFIQGQSLDAVLEELRRLRRCQPDVGALRGVEDQRRRFGSLAHKITAAAVAQSLLTGQFALHEPLPRVLQGASASDGPSPPSPNAPQGLTRDPTATAADPEPEQAGTAAAPPASSDSSATVSLPGQADLSSLSSSKRGYWHGVAWVGLQVAEALAYAHGQRILHRDIKPSNLLLDTRGNVWLADFGLAKASDGEDLTHTGDVVGTLRYLAPERLRGQSDPRGDVYSLGLTLYELLTMRPAFDASDRERLIQQVTQCEPMRPRQLDAGVPRDLETIVLKAIAREPEHRYATAAALADDLQRFVEDRPIRARRISVRERFWRLCKRNPVAASLLASLVVTLVTGFIVSTSQWIRAEANAEQLAQQLYTSDMISIQQAWDTGAIGRMGELLDRHRPLHGRRDRRGFEWYVFWRRHQRARPDRTLPLRGAVWDLAATPDGQTVAAWIFDHEKGRTQVTLWDAATGWVPRTFYGPRGGQEGTFITSMALSPDGRVFATRSQFDKEGREGTFINLWDAATGELRQSLKNLEEGTEDAQGLAFSHDGMMLVSGHSKRTIRLWDLETGQARTIEDSSKQTYDVKGVAISTDGTRIASACSDYKVRLWDVRTGRVMHTFPRFGEAMVMTVAFSPDGRYLAAGSWDGAGLWDLTTWEACKLQGQSDEAARSVAFSPEGSVLAVASTNTIKLWKVETGEAWATLKGHSNMVFDIAFLEGGRTLASASLDQTVKLWDLTHSRGEPEILTGSRQGRSSGGLAFSTDGRALASVSGNTVTSWDVDTGREHQPLEAPAEAQPGIFEIAISRDGRTLAAACHESGQAILWDLETGLIRRRIRHDSVGSVAFSPKGTILATGSIAHTNPLKLWNADTGQLLSTLEVGPRNARLAFSPDGRTLASGDFTGAVKLWDVATGRNLAVLPGHTANVRTVTFSLDGRALASGSWDGTVRVWDVADVDHPSPRHTQVGHAAQVLSVAFSPDGTTLASASADGTVKLWDPATGRERCTLVGHDHPVHSVAFSPDGQVLASRDGGGTIRLWRR